MKTKCFALTVLSFVLFVSMACSISQAQSTVPPEATPYLQVTSDASSGREGTQYWKGTLPDSFYLLGMNGPIHGPFVEFSGIPFMVLGYDMISGDVTSVDFGMSEVTYKILDSSWSLSFEYPANSDASSLPRELGLTGPVWRFVGSNTLNGLINMGVQQFSFRHGYEKWTFNYTSDQMTGGIENLDPNGYSGFQSKTNAFHLYRISNGR